MNLSTRRLGLTGIIAAAASICACDKSVPVNVSPEPDQDSGIEPDASDDQAPIYALQTMIYNPDDSVTSYVTLTDTLDIEGELSLKDAREFPSYAFITPVDGKLLVSSGEAPVITQYAIDEDHNWSKLAELSFASYGVQPFGVNFERHWFLNKNTAYLTLEVTSRIVWDPANFEIIDVKTDTNLDLERDELQLDATLNRPPRILKGPVLKPFFYRDADWVEFGAHTPIAVYDPTTHEEQDILDVPCPALEVASQDEQGNTYFSPWTYGPTASLFGEGPAVCIRRVKGDSTLDEEWTPDLTTWTDGRPVMVFRYWQEGKALATVLHVDEVDGDFENGYDEELAAELDLKWRLWLFDLNTETAQPVEGIGSTGSGFHLEQMDGRAFVFVPNADWTRSTVYEVETDGTAKELFEVQGIVSNWIKVR